MIIERVLGGVLFWRNAFPHIDGISQTLSPRTIVTGRGIDFFNMHCSKLEFGRATCRPTKKVITR